MVGQMVNGLLDQHPRLLAGTVGPEKGDEGRFSRLGVLAGTLAGGRLVAAMIDEVVGNLESEADVAGIAAIGRPGLAGEADDDARRLDRIFDQRAGLELLHPGDVGKL